MAKKTTVRKIDVKAVGKTAPVAVAESGGVATLTEPQERTVTHEQIAAKAKEIWISRGLPWGQDLEIWLEAERQLRG
jgi:hypothetical protein